MKNRRFFWQIFPSALFIIIISIGAAGWYGTQLIRSFHYHEMEEDIGDRALLLRPHIIQLLDSNDDQLQEFCRQTGRAATTRITVIAGNGTVLADSNEDPSQMDNHKNRPEIQTAITGKMDASLRFSKTLSQNMLYVAIPLNDDNPQDGVLRLSVSAAALDAVIASLHKQILYGIFFIALVAAGLSYYLARRISSPLEEMRRGAERLAGGDTDRPIIINDNSIPREMTELSHSLNNMAEQLNGRIKIISQQRNELEAVFSSMTDGVLAIGNDHSIIHINRAAARLFHINHRTVQGLVVEGIIRNRLLQKFLADSLQSDVTITKDLSLMENGQEMTLRVHAHPLNDGEERRMGSLIVLHNLTRINQLESIRQDFVANVSHELKTPITAIRGYVETLLDGAIDNREDAEKFLNIIHRQGSRLDAIVDDLLTLARIEDTAEKNEMEMQEETISPILEAVIQTCRVAAEQKNITITMQCLPEQLTATINRSMLEQAIINLLTNAVTYSPEGSTIHLRAEQQNKATTNQSIRIDVQDQGPGISHEHQKRIFERFYRCDKARSREHGGTGLGLAIVKHIAACHNGEVELQSRMGSGSTFSLILPKQN
ncbi:PAS domain S-box [Desulfocapsa sulfexigens DSM 10523]|uniref:histidine kinase n=1 Tax=Desulfocapsa sulfexigens (strain DSM 10523 / SB164P1) TaxID=1167006 RepID=M1PLZ3_DESSD|nr:ATP-binding protein [Desulfocapsa sulfexigens]AGF77466.1 PAS domain S-box [Desulfocapsa sulfexigens DSM 10523]